jgi:cyclopropane fatty-acyl-phospholipid synthase-like methyltransferase
LAKAALVSILLATGCSSAKHGERGDSHSGDHATAHHRFDDAEKWATRFEDPTRDEWQRPDRVLELLELKPDSRVADIGAATGYFPVRFARAAPKGVIYGLDIEPNLVNYLNLRAHAEGLTNLVSLVCKTDDPSIPEPVDLVFVCDTYHHIGDRVEYFSRLKKDLRPGGRLAIVDFKKGDFPVGPKDPSKLAPEKVIAELAEAGYRLVKQDNDLPYQYVLVLEPL